MTTTKHPASNKRTALLLACIWLLPSALLAAKDEHAVILLYHHISDSTPPSTSISPGLFAAHLDYLAENDYRVLPLSEVAAALRDKRPLAERSVAISFDDGYRSILDEALPRLAARSWPFTVFVSTDAIDQKLKGYLTWDELRQIEKAGGSIANHTSTHEHLIRRRENESGPDWLRRVRADIENAAARLDAELESPAKLLAWPYGEYDNALEQLADDLGYLAFGQQSGPAGYTSSLQALPRFPMAASFASLDSLPDKLRSRPLPLKILSPATRVLESPAKAPQLKARISNGPYRQEALRCYVGGQQAASIQREGDTLTVTAQSPLRPGRGKFNCTVPATSGNGVYYWYSYLWLQPEDDGRWYEE